MTPRAKIPINAAGSSDRVAPGWSPPRKLSLSRTSSPTDKDRPSVRADYLSAYAGYPKGRVGSGAIAVTQGLRPAKPNENHFEVSFSRPESRKLAARSDSTACTFPSFLNLYRCNSVRKNTSKTLLFALLRPYFVSFCTICHTPDYAYTRTLRCAFSPRNVRI